MTDFQEIIAKQLTAKEDHVTQQFRNLAISSGWPVNVASRIDLSLSLDGITYVVPEDIQSTVDDLEYGSQEGPPKPVMRTFENTIDKSLEKDLTDKITAQFMIDLETSLEAL